MSKKRSLPMNVLSTLAVTSMLFSVAVTPAMAAQGDYYDSTAKIHYTVAGMSAATKADLVAAYSAGDSFIKEQANNKFLDYTAAYAKLGQLLQSGLTGLQAIQNIAADASLHPTVNTSIYTPAPDSTLTVSSVSAINVTTVVGTMPVLPETVTATMSDGTTKDVAVTWDAVDASSYAATGSFSVSGTIANSTTVKATANVSVEEAQLAITNKAILSADSTAGTLKADGKTVMTVTATYKNAVEQGFTGTAELVSKNGLASAQIEAAFDKGIATFNVTLPNSTTDIHDELSVRVKTSNLPAAVNVESSKILLTYKAYVPGPDNGSTTTTRTYTVDAVKSSDLADRVNVYVANVANSDLQAVKDAIVGQLTLDNKHQGTHQIAIATIDTANVVGTPTTSTSASYVFSALVKLNNGADYLYDNQINDYTIADATTDIKLATTTGSFALIDKTQPVMAAVNLPILTPQTNTIAVTFSEPINTEPAANLNSTNSALLPANWVLNGHVLLATDLIATGITVMPGNDRNTVNINLTNSAAQKYLFDGENLIQAKSISDWAGLTDLTDNNKITTQDFKFTYTKPVATPGLAINLESPEQYVLALGTSLYTDKDATTEYDLAAAGALKVELIDSTSKVQILDLAGDYAIIPDPANTGKYLLELNQDWTKLLTNPTTYHNQTLKVSIGTAYDVYGNQVSGALNAAATETQPLSGTVVIPEDTTSPASVSKVILNLVNAASQNAAGNVTTTGNVAVTMTEPVQLLTIVNGTTTTLMDEGLTPSLQQDQIGGVPVPTFEYVKVANDPTVANEAVKVGDKIDGHIVVGSVPAHEYNFTVAPNVALEPGEWQLVIRSISDDIGNTMKTETINVVIPATGTVIQPQIGDNQVDPYVVWAYAENDKVAADGSTNDYVKILYSRQMSADALRSATYDINGKQVNQDASITADNVVLYRQNQDPTDVNYNKFYGENNNMSDWTGELVTIKLPSTFITGDDITGTTKNMLTLPATLFARDDSVATTTQNLLLTNNGGSNQFELTFNTDRTKLPAKSLLPVFSKNLQYTSTTSYLGGIVQADLTAYNAALAAVKAADYTPASWTTYQTVVTANVVTAQNTQAEVTTATANIVAAQAALVAVTPAGNGFTYTTTADPLGNTIVNVTVTAANVTAVTVKGSAAVQQGTTNVWRAGLAGTVTIVNSDIVLTVTTPASVDAINTTTSNASKGLVGDAFVLVQLNSGITATSVTADGKAMTLSNGYYTVDLNSYNTTTNTVSVVVTTANGTQTLPLTVK